MYENFKKFTMLEDQPTTASDSTGNTDGEDTQHDEDFWQYLNSKQDELTSDEQLILANKQLEQAESLYKIECDKVRGLREELASLREQLKIEKENNANAVKFIGDLNAQLKQKEDENRDLKDKIKCALVLIASKPDEDVKMAYDVLDKTRQ